MTIILMRHAERERCLPENEAPLTVGGRNSATETAIAIPMEVKKSGTKIRPFDIILYGGTAAAEETARKLKGSETITCLPCEALSPAETDLPGLQLQNRVFAIDHSKPPFLDRQRWWLN